MKTKHLFLLPALAFFACAGLQAQVTIGGDTDATAGTLLDLNSTVKGGLLLSNVAIDNLLEIPSSFPVASGVDPATLKEGLTGSIVYNTGPGTCPGVHVWNGEYWERIVSKVPVPAPGILQMTSDPATLLVDDSVKFSVTTTSSIYKWYASMDSAPYEYLGLTTTPTFSNIFPAGSHKVKVIIDDCQSLKEDEESFIVGSMSPNFGSLAGGNIIYIYGDFPYVATSEYVPDDLVAHFDGVNNQGLGDRGHDFNAVNWKDLKNDFYLPRNSGGTGRWLGNGFQALNNTYSFSSNTFPTNTYPLGGDARTVEVIFRTPDSPNMFIQEDEVQRRIFEYGNSSATQMFGIQYRGLTNDQNLCDPDNHWIFYPIFGYEHNLVTCLSSTPSLETPNMINTVTSTYAFSIANEEYTNSYINNLPAQIVRRIGGGSLNTGDGVLRIGNNLSHSTFLSVRLYSRVLTSAEIAKNAALDQIRYLAPPTVSIDGVECTEVVVLSPHFLMCKVPAGIGIGEKTVKLNGNDYTHYTYVDPVSDFYISEISPITGGVGTTLTLKGNKLGDIDTVEVGGVLCPATTRDAATYASVLPNTLPYGEVDIIITLTDGKTYRFAKVFEYR